MRTAALSRLFCGVPLFIVAVALTGCWTAPVATQQPGGQARLIQGGIDVESAKDSAVISAVDRNASTIVLRAFGKASTSMYKVGPQVSTLNDLKAGDVVQATVTEELTVYRIRDGQLPGAEGTVPADARVLSVDPSYRLLKLQYPDGENETIKVPLGTRLEDMQAGDSVVIRPVELLALHRKG
jgi:hypothetical protein